MKLYATVLFATLFSIACGDPPSIISTTTLGDTFDTVGPYQVRVLLHNPQAADTVRLTFQLEGAEPQAVGMSEVSVGVFEGAIPGASPFSLIRYWVEVRDGEQLLVDPPAPRSPYTFWVLGVSCDQDADCMVGQRCDDSGVCRDAGATCEVDQDCGKAFRCLVGVCAPVTRSCTFDQGCLLGEICSVLLGQCQVRPSCLDDLLCPLDFVCREGACRRGCAGDADCFPTEACIQGECGAPDPCEDDAQCPTPLVCDPAVGMCRLRGGALCSPCAADADCGGPNDHCLPLDDGLGCGRDCSLSSCEEGYHCDTSRILPQCVPVLGRCP
ncbi:MAG: hypothetical protein JRH20_13930 [Deltaproteobacteria bacterium]|nr:hypothetical protein [Deltaproteobacteria bacterium]